MSIANCVVLGKAVENVGSGRKEGGDECGRGGGEWRARRRCELERLDLRRHQSGQTTLGLGGEPPWVFKKARGDSPKDSTGNVSDVSHSARLDRCHRPDAKQLDKKPEPNQKPGRDQGDTHEDEDE